MDEIQVAAMKNQTIYKTFKKADLLNKQTMYKNDVKILEYTATPDGTIYDLMKWDDASFKILADAGEGYISSYNLLQLGRVKQYKELCFNKKSTDYDSDDNIIDDSINDTNNINENIEINITRGNKLTLKLNFSIKINIGFCVKSIFKTSCLIENK